MNVLPGYGRSMKLISKLIGMYHFHTFKKSLPSLVKRLIQKKNIVTTPFHVVSFSGSKTFEEQAYSVLSFYCNVGVPASWTVYTDGTYTSQQISLIKDIPFLRVLPWNERLQKRVESLIHFGKINIWGNRIHAYMNHPIEGTTIFSDSDILFFNRFKFYEQELTKGNWFIPDTGPNFDSYYFEICNQPQQPFINAGLLVINKTLNWDKALNYIFNRSNAPSTWEHFTEQAAMHTMLIDEDELRCFNSEDFILSCTDSFKPAFDYNPRKIALRHFVSPVRHKMWQYSWKKVLRF